jgi:putative redox protein
MAGIGGLSEERPNGGKIPFPQATRLCHQRRMASSSETLPPVVARPEGAGRFATRVEVPGGVIHADEPVSAGGGGGGPTPYQLLSAGLAACTSMTIRLYTTRKPWTLPDHRVEVAHALVPGDPPRDHFTRRILFAGPVSDDIRARLLDIAEKCPVHRTLSGGGAEIITTAEADAPLSAAPIAPADPPAAHVEQMEQACAERGD